jgi:hypothetical protein
VEAHTVTKHAENFKQSFTNKLMATVSWDRKGLMVHFKKQGRHVF